jgi:chorismate mutase
VTNRPIAAPLAALVLALTLTGCGAGSRADSSGQEAAPTTTPGTAAPSPATTSPPGEVPADVFDPVVALVVERLEVAPEVAASKHFSGQPVTDEAREQVVLDSAAEAATASGTDADYVTAVFADQIAASKQVQEALLAEWAAGGPGVPETAPDLAVEVRPVLDRITVELVPALAEVEPYGALPGCAEALDEALA